MDNNLYIEKYKNINNINKLNDNIFQFPNIIEQVENDFKILDSLIKDINNEEYNIVSNNLEIRN